MTSIHSITNPKPRTRKERVKKWANDHRVGIVLGSYCGLVVVGTIASAVLAYKGEVKRINAHNEYVHEFNNWLNDTQNSGNRVYQLVDGRYLVVPVETTTELVMK